MKKQLIATVINNKDRISYINLIEDDKYLGWTHDFNIIFRDGVKMGLDLNKEEDLFLLFVLALFYGCGSFLLLIFNGSLSPMIVITEASIPRKSKNR